MCGISGILNDTGREQSQAVIRKMIQVLRHRGPDGQGIYTDEEITLGHVRLSIIDVEGSRQPLANEDESVWVSFNGEIYNYREIREKLIARGHTFRTQGDTEILVHLYEEYGEEMVHSLQGMFAFAIWDKKQKKLLLVRDRMGIKPLYYFQNGDLFIFASEPKAILQHPAVQASPNPESIWHYLTYRSVPSPYTLFKNIQKLSPGHFLTVTSAGVREKGYWDIPLAAKSEKPRVGGDEEQWIQAAEALLLQSVKRRLISDVPLGAFLSGGVDSSLIVAMMSKITQAPVKTYSVGFRDFPSSELVYAASIARLYKTEHHELVLEAEEFMKHLEKLTWMRDSPLSERSDIPLYLLAAEARKTVKVLLSGEGSDELFAGYPKYAVDCYSPWFALIPSSLLCWIGDRLPARGRRLEIALRSFSERRKADRWAQWFSPFTRMEKIRLMNSVQNFKNPTSRFLKTNTLYENLDEMLYADCKIWLPENLLERGDRMTMAASVEGRVPFLDHEVVEFAFRMPHALKIRGRQRKWLIKQVARKYLPPENIYRKKVGFEVPLADWFRGKLKEMCYDRICRKDGLPGQLFSEDQLRQILDDHCTLKKDNFLKIWTLLGLSVWYDQFCGKQAGI